MKVFVLAPREDWICDRFVNEWYEHNPDISTKNVYEADVVWLLADWAYDQLPYDLLKQKVVITSVHHITPDKFNNTELQRFAHRDVITDAYHVPCELTQKQVQEIQQKIGSTKPIFHRPFWVNNRLWFPPTPEQRKLARKSLGIAVDDTFVIMSAQRDTEGSDLSSPKLEKGPDIFANMVIDHVNFFKECPNLPTSFLVLLGGWRRQYLINRLSVAGIPYIYKERPPIETVRDMYWASNLYVVGARYEGGPQSIVECAATKTPIVSTSCGLAPEILKQKSLFDGSNFSSFFNAQYFAFENEAKEHNFSKVSEHFLEPSFAWYREWLQKVWKENK